MNGYNKYKKYKLKYINLQNRIRYQHGGANGYFPLNDEIHFWGRQLMEHALFLNLGLELKDGTIDLKQEALDMVSKWKNFLETNFYDHGIQVNKDTVFLPDDSLDKIREINIDELNKEYLEPMIKFNSKIVDMLNGGKWIGWIYPALASHMLEEALYFQRKISGNGYPVEEEIAFINKHHGEEMGATAQLIDPTEQATIDLVRSYAMKAMSKLINKQALSSDEINADAELPENWTPEEEEILKGLGNPELNNLLILSIRYSKELTDFAIKTNQKVKNNELKSVIHPILGKHVYREFARFTETLNKINNKLSR